tara:strand:+ start:9 stop:308 length:300 start_codon:yes stop_codon:yes gene_type:complete
MENLSENITKDLLKLLQDFITENEIEMSDNVNETTRLIGTSSVFDSIELVTFIVEVEQFLEDKYKLNVQLTSESAMSRRTSPFISLQTLVKYIIELSNE